MTRRNGAQLDEEPALEERLTDKQLLAVDALVAGASVAEAASAAGVDRVTLWRWRQDAAFEAAINARRLELHEARGERLRALVDKALDALAGVLADPDAPAAARIKAASTVLGAAGLAELAHPSTRTTTQAVEAARATERRRRVLMDML